VLGIIPLRHEVENFLRCDTEELITEHNNIRYQYICIVLEATDRSSETLLLVSRMLPWYFTVIFTILQSVLRKPWMNRLAFSFHQSATDILATRTHAFICNCCHNYGIYRNKFNTQKLKLIYKNKRSLVRRHTGVWHASLYRHINATVFPFASSFVKAEVTYHWQTGLPCIFLFVKFVLITDHTCKELQLWQSTCVIA
jgi:hypothetical protein